MPGSRTSMGSARFSRRQRLIEVSLPGVALTQEGKKAFTRAVKNFYKKQGRVLPWRETLDPYAIMVSELMLQQTQVDRVIPKYLAFIAEFPTLAELHKASLKKVLIAWQGLGYNRRAVLLKKAAAVIVNDWHGKLPATVAALEDLPGIGPYSARAIAVFAYNQPHVLIETNIRAVYLHTFFAGQSGVLDQQLLPLIEQTLALRYPRRWYWALMDYGSYLKKTQVNPSRQSAHHVRQASFQNSNRQLRGRIVAHLTQSPPQTAQELARVTSFPLERVQQCVTALAQEGIIQTNKRRYQLSSA